MIPFQKSWQLQTAKARFSELFHLVLTQGPQWVTRHGKETIVLLSATQFEQLQKRQQSTSRLVDFFAQSPLAGMELPPRTPDYGRDHPL